MEAPKQGEFTNKLWKYVADLEKRVKALENMKVSPQSMGKMLVADGNATLVFDTQQCS